MKPAYDDSDVFHHTARFHKRTGLEMSPLEFDDPYEGERRKKSRRKSHRNFDEDEERIASRQKRSGKRFHRKKTLKDGFWEDDDLKTPPGR